MQKADRNLGPGSQLEGLKAKTEKCLSILSASSRKSGSTSVCLTDGWMAAAKRNFFFCVLDLQTSVWLISARRTTHQRLFVFRLSGVRIEPKIWVHWFQSNLPLVFLLATCLAERNTRLRTSQANALKFGGKHQAATANGLSISLKKTQRTE